MSLYENEFRVCFMNDIPKRIFYYLVVAKYDNRLISYIEEEKQNEHKVVKLLRLCNSTDEFIDFVENPIMINIPSPFGKVDVTQILKFDVETWRRIVKMM